MFFSRINIVFLSSLAFIGGIFAVSLRQFPEFIVSGFFILGALFPALFILGRKRLAAICLLLIFFTLGVWRYQAAEHGISESYVLALNDSGRITSFVGAVVAEPDIRPTNIKLEIKPEGYTGKGKVLVTLPRYPEYQYGDQLQITGKLQTPAELDDFNYRDYLKKDGIYSVMYWPEIGLIARRQGNFLYAKILDIKYRLRNVIQYNLSPPQSSILGAMILGDKRKISDDWKEKLNIAGVRHITAISGMHVAILTSTLMIILIGLGLWRQQAFYLTLITVSLFIVMTGLQPSAVRAGIMGGLLLMAQHLGRLNDASRAVVFSAAIMLFLNPFLLRLDVGFQLSFAAIMGIIYLSPVFANWFSRPNFAGQNLGGLKAVLAMTLSAYTFTAPILIYNFGQISLIGIFTNLLIVPILWLVMLSGFAFALAGIIWQPLGWLLSWPAWLLLTYITKLVDWFSSVPLAAVTWRNAHWLWMLAAYAVIIFTTWKLRQKLRFRFLGPS